MHRFSQVTRSLARVFTLDRMEEEILIANASIVCLGGKRPRWLRPVAKEIAEFFNQPGERPLCRDVESALKRCRVYRNAWRKGKINFYSGVNPLPKKMLPGHGAPETWAVPAITHFGELTRVLEIHMDDLGWLMAQFSKTEHYHLRWHRKKKSSRHRLIEIPKPLLKDVQRTILTKILDSIPAHESACGFQRGKSVLDFVKPHTGQSMVLKMDFQDFFPSISSGRVLRLFMTAGYPESIAGALTDLCTHAVDRDMLAGADLDRYSRECLARKHLPQGAPTSPALANLCAFRLDCRLSGLARQAGANYTRYADDLLFSGGDDFRRRSEAFRIMVMVIAIEEGFRINSRKTRFMKASQKQSAGGLVINQKPNLSKHDFDELKAILTNCVRHGWKSQNRENHPAFQAHLEGRIGWAAQANPVKAEKLRELFDKINWGAA